MSRALSTLLAISLASPFAAGAQDAGLEAGIVDAGPRPDIGPISRLDAGVAVLPDLDDDEEEAESDLPEDRRPDVTLRLEPESGTMTGDVVTAVITVTLVDGDDVAVPRQRFGDLELHDQRHTDALVDGRRVFTFELDFLMLEPGEQELPPIRLRVVTADGVVGIVRTEATTITVGSLTAAEPDAVPRPATPADIVVMQDDYTLAWVFGILGAMLVSALLGWLLARWWRGRPQELPPPPPPRPPWEVALEKLTALRRELAKTTRDADAVTIVDRASDALREYLGGRYDFNGLESTTDEVIARMKNARLQSVSLNEIIALLGDADLVKFAKAVPDQAQCERMIEGAEKIVKGTIPMSTSVSRPAPSAGRTSFPSGAKDPRAAWSPEIEVKKGRASALPDATKPGGDDRRVDEDGNVIPDTLPPAAPKPVKTEMGPLVQAEAETGAGTGSGSGAGAGSGSGPGSGSGSGPGAGVSHDTLRDGGKPPAVDVAAPADDEPARHTPVGFTDPGEGPKA